MCRPRSRPIAPIIVEEFAGDRAAVDAGVPDVAGREDRAGGRSRQGRCAAGRRDRVAGGVAGIGPGRDLSAVAIPVAVGVGPVRVASRGSARRGCAGRPGRGPRAGRRPRRRRCPSCADGRPPGTRSSSRDRPPSASSRSSRLPSRSVSWGCGSRAGACTPACSSVGRDRGPRDPSGMPSRSVSRLVGLVLVQSRS